MTSGGFMMILFFVAVTAVMLFIKHKMGPSKSFIENFYEGQVVALEKQGKSREQAEEIVVSDLERARAKGNPVARAFAALVLIAGTVIAFGMMAPLPIAFCVVGWISLFKGTWRSR